MKVTIDLDTKTITFFEEMTMKKLIQTMEELRPGDWMEYIIKFESSYKGMTDPFITTNTGQQHPFNPLAKYFINYQEQCTPLSGKYPTKSDNK